MLQDSNGVCYLEAAGLKPSVAGMTRRREKGGDKVREGGGHRERKGERVSG